MTRRSLALKALHRAIVNFVSKELWMSSRLRCQLSSVHSFPAAVPAHEHIAEDSSLLVTVQRSQHEENCGIVNGIAATESNEIAMKSFLKTVSSFRLESSRFTSLRRSQSARSLTRPEPPAANESGTKKNGMSFRSVSKHLALVICLFDLATR
jgi:hypothetical protein